MEIECPYCGECFEVLTDNSAGNQNYVEDCQVCCRPILIQSEVDEYGEVRLWVSPENE